MIKAVLALVVRLLQGLPVPARYVLLFCIGMFCTYVVGFYLTWGEMGMFEQGDLLGLLRFLSLMFGVLFVVIAKAYKWLEG